MDEARKVNKKVVFITGCTDGGIGASMALEFAKAGLEVVATARSLNSMKELSLNEKIHPLVLDVTDFEASKAIVENVVAAYGRIDILVNNAGVPCVAPVAEIPISVLESTYRTNIFGPMVLVQAVVPHMAARGNGRIVNVGSVTSLCYGPWAGVYISSKAALEALSDALRLELKPFGIEVILVLPGAIKSNIGKQSVSNLHSGVLEGLKLYKSFEQTLMKRANLSQGPKSTPTEEFAQKTVRQILAKSPPGHFVCGHYGTLFQCLHYVPLCIRDFLWAKMFGLGMNVSDSNKKVD